MAVFLLGCGVDESKLQQQKAQEENKQQSLTSSDEFFAVDGYVSPINISVNNQQYKDSEDFYTKEVDRLTESVHQKYPGYSLYFDADVGLQDFKQGLSVFLVASNDSGVASESSVDSRGKFTFNLPSNVEKQDLYTLRASKRIGLRLVKDQDVISWCYNLFAEKEVSLDGKSVILRNFETNITSYKCEQKEEQITVPDNPYNYVVEAFESADTYHGYGPLPKKPSQPVITPVPVTTPTPETDPTTTEDNGL